MTSLARKLTLTLAALAIAAGVGFGGPAKAGSVPETDNPIKIAMNEWTGQHIDSYVMGELLKKMGYTVEYVTAGYYPMLQALKEANLHIGSEVWQTNVGPGFFDMVAAGEIEIVSQFGIEAGQGWMYPAFVEETCPGLPSWEALAECQELFATPDTYPQGRFVEYPADWGDTGNPERIDAFGLDYMLIPAGSEGALVAEIKSAYVQKTPLFIMFWRPHWVHAVYDMKLVDLPVREDACFDDPAWGPIADKTHDCSHGDDEIYLAVWPGMKEKWPGAYEFLSQFRFFNSDQEPIMKAVDLDGKDILDEVTAWIDANQNRWQPWMDNAMGH